MYKFGPLNPPGKTANVSCDPQALLSRTGNTILGQCDKSVPICGSHLMLLFTSARTVYTERRRRIHTHGENLPKKETDQGKSSGQCIQELQESENQFLSLGAVVGFECVRSQE
ncbi:hypothetical protein JTB14_018009 [Gonioctena quinquepunctata]|nr:hypothetical protein JTB14_018009 [Gonioctena quinquepunctata]